MCPPPSSRVAGLFSLFPRALALTPLLASIAACAGAPPAAPPATPAVADTSVAAPVASAPSPAAAPSSSSSASSDTLATDLLAKNHAPFEACVSDAHHKRTTTIQVTFTLGDDGMPMTVELEYKNKMDEGAKECLRKAALAIAFPSKLAGQKKVGTLTLAPSK